jgi:hypothetical protein
MDIPLRDTQSAHASAQTLVKLITNYSHYLQCHAPRRQQRRPPSRDLDSRTALCDLIHSARISFDRHYRTTTTAVGAVSDMALPAAPCNAMQQGRTAECHCARLVAHNDHPASPLHRRPIRRPA